MGMRCMYVLALVCMLRGLWPSVGVADDRGTDVGERLSGEVIVKYRRGAHATSASLHRLHGTRVLRSYRAFAMDRVEIPSGKSVAEAIHELQSDPDVEYAEPNYRVHAQRLPNDPMLAELWGMQQMQAVAAWDTSTGAGNLVVAVIDSGIDATHPDLRANVWTNSAEADGIPGVDDDGNGVVDDVRGFDAITGRGVEGDSDGHGTHVAGIIGAVGNNGLGVVGINWNVQIMPCRFLDASGSGSIADAIACLDYVARMSSRGVNIVATNNSWAGGDFSQALFDAINAQRQILFVAAAGNGGGDNDTTPSYPAGFDLTNVLAVAATTVTDSLTTFSQFGRRTVHLGAPGLDIVSTVPGGGYASQSGTSMSAPHVTGLVALLKAANPAADWRTLRNLILAGGDVVPSLLGTTITGRRANAAGSLNCLEQSVFAPLHFTAQVQVGSQSVLRALSINCAVPVGPVLVTLSGGEPLVLHDDGVAPDQAAGDGIFSAVFTPVGSPEGFLFTSPAGSEQIGPPPPLLIGTQSLSNAVQFVPYSQTLQASGGTAPYLWQVTGGTPPSGIVLGGTGLLSGTPMVVGQFPLTVTLSDAEGRTVTRSYLLQVNDPFPPETIIASGPAQNSTEAVAIFTFTSNQPSATFRCAMNGADEADCSSPFSTGLLADGIHTFSVRSVLNGSIVDPTPAQKTWTSETGTPLVSIDSVVSPTKESSQLISGTVVTGFTPSVAASPPATVEDFVLSDTTWSARISGMPAGDTLVSVQTVAADGRVSSKIATVRVILPDGRISGGAAVSLFDALLALRVAVGLVTPDAEQLLHGDVVPPGGDGHIDVRDVLMILRAAVGLVVL